MAITTTEEYFANLSILSNVNQPVYASLPAAENTFDIDLNTRKINAPKVLSIEKDHKSEVIYFQVDRFADYMDLAHTCCVVQYNVQRKDAKGNTVTKTYFYPVPFFDIYRKVSEKKIIFPWCLDASVTSTSGIVEFAVCFFKTGVKINENGQAEQIYTYKLSTLPAKSEVIKGIVTHAISTEQELDLANMQYLNLWREIDLLKEGVSTKLFWTILPNPTNPVIDDSEISGEMGGTQEEIDSNLDTLREPDSQALIDKKI